MTSTTVWPNDYMSERKARIINGPTNKCRTGTAKEHFQKKILTNEVGRHVPRS